MKELVFIEEGKVVTDSLTIAEVFKKRHADVMRDIEVQINKLKEAGEEEWGLRNFAHTLYQQQQNRQMYPKYNMTEDGFAIIAMSYITPEAMKMKVKFLSEFKRMKHQLELVNRPSYMIDDPIARAEKWIQEQKERQLAETKALMLEQRVAEYEPKVNYVDQILKSKDTVTITQISKDYGLSGQKLNQILKEAGVQFKQSGQWLLYSKHQNEGYTKSETFLTEDFGRVVTKIHTKWTQKGRLFIHEILKKRGIHAVMDRQREQKKELVFH